MTRRALITSPSRIREIPWRHKLAILTFRFWRASEVSHALGKRVTLYVNTCQSHDLFPVSVLSLRSLIRQDPRISFHGESRAMIKRRRSRLRVWRTQVTLSLSPRRQIKLRVVRGWSWIENKEKGERKHSSCVCVQWRDSLIRLLLLLGDVLDGRCLPRILAWSRLATRGNVIITGPSLITLEVSHYRWVVGARRWDSAGQPCLSNDPPRFSH